jgi:hypothetical protein
VQGYRLGSTERQGYRLGSTERQGVLDLYIKWYMSTFLLIVCFKT